MQNSLPPYLLKRSLLSDICYKASIRMDDQYLLPEYALCLSLLCAAAVIISSAHRREASNLTGTKSQKISLPPLHTIKGLRGTLQSASSSQVLSQMDMHSPLTLSPPTSSPGIVHVGQVSLAPSKWLDTKSSKSQTKIEYPTPAYDLPNIPFVPQPTNCQVERLARDSKRKGHITVHPNSGKSHVETHSHSRQLLKRASPHKSSHNQSGGIPPSITLSCKAPTQNFQKALNCNYINTLNHLSESHHPKEKQLLKPTHCLTPPHTKMQAHDEIAVLLASIAPAAADVQNDIPVPNHITATRDWSLSCLAKVITDRSVIDDNFTSTMLRNWGVHPATRISPIARGTYLVDFVCDTEMYEVLRKEPWGYRGDVVSLRKVYEPAHLTSDFINHVSLWTQFHNVPAEMLSAEGIQYLAQQIGSPLSEVRQGYNGGRLFMRAKICYVATSPLKDRLNLNHPSLGTVPVYLVYEHATRLCPYCGIIGHDISGCTMRDRVLQLCADPRYSHRHELQMLRDHRKGAWINCPALVPRPLPPPHFFTNMQPNQAHSPSYESDPDQEPLHHPNPAVNPFPAPNFQADQNPNQAANASPLSNLENELTQGEQHSPLVQSTRALADPPSNPNQASPLRPVRSFRNSLNGAGPSSAVAITNRTQQLSLHDGAARSTRLSPRASLSPPPGYHKRLRPASRESPPPLP